MVDPVGELERGRQPYATRAWLDAYTALSSADRAASLGAVDLELLAVSASMVGRMDDLLPLLERAHDAFVDAGEALRLVAVPHERAVGADEQALHPRRRLRALRVAVLTGDYPNVQVSSLSPV
ncbi:MAG: hypothetical protein H0T20_07860 [Actinobacteria bacterium]|nr:hypothetical protein [Actinomycetota bacterium]